MAGVRILNTNATEPVYRLLRAGTIHWLWGIHGRADGVAINIGQLRLE
jgi:hypothetical protein